MCKCDVCGALTDTIVCCSACGGMTFAYCKECLESGAEPWDELVNYISIAGHYPEEINSNYRDIVKDTCKRLGKSEDDFANAVNALNKSNL